MTTKAVKVGILTVSDSCSANTAEDLSGANLCRLIVGEGLIQNGEVTSKEIVPDDLETIQNKLMEWCDKLKLNLILTTGGTGFSPRDVTPEATKSILEKEANGLTIAMISQSLQVTKLAMLSRLVCGSRGQTLIVNLPGSTKGSEECFRFALPGIPHAVDLLRSDKTQVQKTHAKLQGLEVKHDKENRHMDVARDVLKKYSKQFLKSDKQKRKHRGRILGVMVKQHVKQQEVLDLDCDGRNTECFIDKRDSSNGSLNSIPETENLAVEIIEPELVVYDNERQVNLDTGQDVEYLNETGVSGQRYSDTGLNLPEISHNSEQSNSMVLNQTGVTHPRYSDTSLNLSDIHRNNEQHSSMILNSSNDSICTNNIVNLVLDSEQNMSTNFNESVEIHCGSNGNLSQPSVSFSHPNNEPTKTEENYSMDEYLNQCFSGVSRIQLVGAIAFNSSENSTLTNYDMSYHTKISAADLNNPPQNTLTNSDITNHKEVGVAEISLEDGNLTQEEAPADDEMEDPVSSHGSPVHELVSYVESDDENPVKHDISIYDIETEASNDKFVLPKSYRSIRKKFPSRPLSRTQTFDSDTSAVYKPEQKTKRAARNVKPYIETRTCEVGKNVYKFFAAHPKIKGIYLNKGKRHVKRNLVTLKRQNYAVDQGSWKRGDAIHDRNRLDDYFELTEEGRRKKRLFDNKMTRDEYVVNWYLFCPGHGNCKRTCGGFGKCIDGCPGMAHKQDRHNCDVMVHMKLLLSDVSHWRIQVKGQHVPDNMLWTLPQDQKRMTAVSRDSIFTSYSETKKDGRTRPKSVDKDKKQLSKYMACLKRRRQMKTYNARKQVEEETEETPKSRNDTEVYTFTAYKVDDTSAGNLLATYPSCLSQETVIYAESPSHK